MKLLAVLFVASLAVVRAATCDLNKLASIASNPAVATCAKASGYVPPSRPTDAQLTIMCTSEPCKQLIKDIDALELPECEIGVVSLRKDVLDRVATACAALEATPTPTPSPSSSAPVSCRDG